MTTLGTGSFGDWNTIVVCNDAVNNIASAGMLRQMDYGLMLTRVSTIFRLSDSEIIPVRSYSDSGLPYCPLMDVLP